MFPLACERLEDRWMLAPVWQIQSWLPAHFPEPHTGTAGMKFEIDQSTTIGAIGAADDFLDGFAAGSIPVAIWTADGDLVFQTSILSSDPSVLGFRYAVADVELSAGEYVTGAFYQSEESFLKIVDVNVQVPGFSEGLEAREKVSGTLEFPSQVAGDTGFLSVNFLVGAPRLFSESSTLVATEGETISHSGTFHGAGENFTLTANVGSVSWTSSDAYSGSWTWSYTPADNLPANVVLTATGTESGHTQTHSFPVSVQNVSPTATGVNGPTSLDEGQPGIYSLSGVFDPSSVDAGSLRYSFASSSSSLANSYAAAGTSNSFTHSFTDNGDFTVFGRVFDKDGGFNTYSTTVTVGNVAPIATGVDGPTLLNRGESGTYSLADVFDPSVADSGSLRYSFALSSDDLAATYSAAGPGTSVSFSFPDVGDFTVFGRVFDKDGGFNTYSTTVTAAGLVLDPLPTVSEGDTAILAGTVSGVQPDNPGILLTIDWGDPLSPGNMQTVTLTSDSSGVAAFSVPHQYLDNPSGTPQDDYTITVSVEESPLIVGADAVFVIDVSGSTNGSFSGTPVGDQNGDGAANRILDAEIAGFKALNQNLIDRGLGDISKVSIVSFSGAITGSDFSNDAARLDMDPHTEGFQDFITPLADTDGDGIRNVDEVLMSLVDDGYTNYEAALQKAIEAIDVVGSPAGTSNVIFMSDGQPNRPTSNASHYLDEVQTIRTTRGQNLRAFGVGNNVNLTRMQTIDANAAIFTSTDQLLDIFSGAGSAGGVTDALTTTITVQNVSPTANLNGPGTTYGTAAVVEFTNPFDPSSTDTAAGFRYAYAVNDASALDGLTYADLAGSPASQAFDLDAGTYTFYARIFDKDDGFTQYDTQVVVSPAVLTITADPQTKVYGDADPALTFAASGFQYSDTAATVLTGELARAPGEDVGTYAIGQGTLMASSNYTLAYTGHEPDHAGPIDGHGR